MIKSLLNLAKGGVGSRIELEKRRQKLEANRSSFLSRARDYARMTLPYLLAPQSAMSSTSSISNGYDANQHGFDSLGAYLVNSLSNKLTMTLFPPQASFFRMEFDGRASEELEAAGYKLTELAKILAVGETRAMKVFSKRGCRSALVETMKHLQVTGNVALFLDPDKTKPVQAIPLDRYYVARDKAGLLLEYMQEDYKEFSTLEENIQTIIQAHKHYKPDANVKVLTYACWHEDKYHVIQAIEDLMVRPLQVVKPRDLPWVPLTWNRTYGESYGRGLIEDHVGDFYVHEFLSEARAKGAALMADIKYLIRPGSTIDIDELIESPSGEYIYGDLNDIGVLQLEKYADFTPIGNIMSEYEQRLGRAFLIGSAQRRDAERVTAYELRLDAQELEVTLGGTYSRLSDTLQKPLALFLFKEIDFPIEKEIDPSITTGLEALGRIGDLEKIAQFSEMMQIPNTWPQPVQERIKWSDYTDSVLASLSLEAPWLMTEEEYKELQQEQAQGQQEDMLAAEAAKAAPGLIEQQMLGGVG